MFTDTKNTLRPKGQFYIMKISYCYDLSNVSSIRQGEMAIDFMENILGEKFSQYIGKPYGKPDTVDLENLMWDYLEVSLRPCDEGFKANCFADCEVYDGIVANLHHFVS